MAEIREAEIIAHGIMRETRSAIAWTGAVSALLTLMTLVWTISWALRGDREKKKKEEEEEEKRRRDKKEKKQREKEEEKKDREKEGERRREEEEKRWELWRKNTSKDIERKIESRVKIAVEVRMEKIREDYAKRSSDVDRLVAAFDSDLELAILRGENVELRRQLGSPPG